MNRGVERTNVNRLIGEKAVVIQKISNLDQTGQVKAVSYTHLICN